MSVLNKASVIGIILLLLILYLQMYLPPNVKKGWRLYVDGKLKYILGTNVGNQIPVKVLKQNRILISGTESHGLLVKASDNTRCIRDIAGNDNTRMVVPYGSSRKMIIAGRNVEFCWFDDIKTNKHRVRG